jgi:hypothetical protein
MLNDGSPDRAELTGCTRIDPLSAMRFPSLASNSYPGYAPTRQNPAAVAQYPPFRSHCLR